MTIARDTSRKLLDWLHGAALAPGVPQEKCDRHGFAFFGSFFAPTFPVALMCFQTRWELSGTVEKFKNGCPRPNIEKNRLKMMWLWLPQLKLKDPSWAVDPWGLPVMGLLQRDNAKKVCANLEAFLMPVRPVALICFWTWWYLSGAVEKMKFSGLWSEIEKSVHEKSYHLAVPLTKVSRTPGIDPGEF